MKSQIKDIVIGIFAVIGFSAIVMGFNNPAEPQQVTYGTPESHVWEFHISPNPSDSSFAINKETGEVRKYNYNSVGRTTSKGENLYFVMVKQNKS